MSNEFTDISVDTTSEVVAEQTLEDAITAKDSAEQPQDQVQEPQQEEKQQEPDQFASKFAALSRREKELRQREADIEARIKELEASQKPAEPEPEPELPLEYRLKRNPLETLKEMGLGLDVLTELALNDGQLTQDMQLKLMKEDLSSNVEKKIAELEAKLAEKEAQEEQERYSQVEQNFRKDINEFVTGKAENYENIIATDSVELVYDLIEETYRETGELLEIEEAAKQVESHLADEYGKLIERLAPKFGFQKGTVEQKPTASERQSSPTLSNTMTSEVSTNGQRMLSDEESKALAASMLKWIE